MDTTMDQNDALAESIKTGIAALVALALGWVLAAFRKADRKEVAEVEKRLEMRITAVESGQHAQAIMLAEVKTILQSIQRDVRDMRNDHRDTNG
jgi:uncharacterized membrane-anchored protein YhcB (DUF1043 family)